MTGIKFKSALIVDDSPDDIYLLKKILITAGMQKVESLSSVDEAVKFVIGVSPFQNRLVPNVIFVDLTMGGVKGFQLLTWLKSNALFKGIPIVVFSRSSELSDESQAMQLGAVAFYKKTNDSDALKAMVADVLLTTGIFEI